MKKQKNNRYVLFGGNFILSNKMQLVADQYVKGLSSKQWFLLRTLSDMPSNPLPTITSLAKESDTTRQNVTKILEVLSRQNYVILKDNESDRRSQSVEISALGLQALRKSAKDAQIFLKQLYAGISDEECAVAARVLMKMVDNLNHMQEELHEEG